MNLLVQRGQLNWVKLKSMELNDRTVHKKTQLHKYFCKASTSQDFSAYVEVTFPARLTHKLTFKQSVFSFPVWRAESKQQGFHANNVSPTSALIRVAACESDV